MLVFAQDSAFGQGNFAAVKAVVGGKGHNVSSLYVPLSATDFTPFAQQAKQAKPDVLYVAWAGATAAQVWSALDQQGVFVVGRQHRDRTRGAGDLPELRPGDREDPLPLALPVPGARQQGEHWLRAQMRKKSQFPDLFTPDGFVAGQMIVQALKKGDYDVDKMIGALEGWKFLAPKGFQAIRPQDHAMLQPMFRISLSQTGKVWTTKLLGTASSYETAPPIVSSFQS